MIYTLKEIQEQFNKIKDNKAKTSKKVTEFGEILASAYRIDADIADEMWQYLVDANVKNTPENAKFYIAQVFYQLTNQLSDEEASELLALTPERVELMILHGYVGWSHVWLCFSTLLKGFLKLDSINNCVYVVERFFEKIHMIDPNRDQFVSVIVKSVEYANELYQENDEYENVVNDFLQTLKTIDNERAAAYVRIHMRLKDYEDNNDLDELISLAHNFKFASEFIELLWIMHDYISEDEFADKWYAYLSELDDEYHYIPYPDFETEKEELAKRKKTNKPYYEGTKMQYFVSGIKGNDDILPFYFKEASSLVDYTIYSWLCDCDWDRFIKYVSLLIWNDKEQRYDHSRIKRILDCYLNACLADNRDASTDEYGRTNKIISSEDLPEFAKALAAISASTVGSPFHDEFHEDVKEFLINSIGNIDVLNNAGFDEEIDERSVDQRFKDYVHCFMQSGELEHDGTNYFYRKLRKEIQDEDFKLRQSDYGTDYFAKRAYSYALDDEICDFFFLHCTREFRIKSDMITCCIKNGNIARALELVDILLQTSEYEEKEQGFSWAFEIKSVADWVVRNFTRAGRASWEPELDITDEDVKTAQMIIEKMIPYLRPNDIDSVKVALMKMLPEAYNDNDYIDELLKDVDIYTTYPKPRGHGTAPEINRISSKVMDSFKILAQKGRLDVISQILAKFAAVKNILKPVAFTTWMGSLADKLDPKDFYKVYTMSKMSFYAWAETKVHDYDVIKVAEKLGAVCSHEEFVEFKNMIVSRHGYVDGISSCFKFTSENTETQLLYDGKTVQLKLDFVEEHHMSTWIEMHLLTKAKSSSVSSIRVMKFELNDILVNDYGTWNSFDDEGPGVGFKVYDDDENDEDITIQSGFFEYYGITKVDKILIKFGVYDDNVKLIETTNDIVIMQDHETGIYNVVNN